MKPRVYADLNPFLPPQLRRGQGRKLTDEQVAIIKRDLGKGETMNSLGRRFGVHPSSIRNIRDGLAHADVQPAPEEGEE